MVSGRSRWISNGMAKAEESLSILLHGSCRRRRKPAAIAPAGAIPSSPVCIAKSPPSNASVGFRLGSVAAASRNDARAELIGRTSDDSSEGFFQDTPLFAQRKEGSAMFKPSANSKLLSSRSSQGAAAYGGYFQPPTAFTTISRVTDNLYLCGALALNETRIKQLGITCIINCAAELPSIQVPGVQSIKVGVDDVPSAPLYVHFDRMADRINEVKQSGGKTLVHCVAGMSRSPTLCLAYLIKHEGMSAQRALDHVVQRRSIVQPNPGFWRQIIDYERRMRAAGGALSSGLSSAAGGAANAARAQSSRRVIVPQQQTTRAQPMSIVALRSPSLMRSFTSWASTYSKDFGSTSLGLLRR